MTGLGQRSMSFSHGFSLQVELAGAVYEPVEDGVGQGRVADGVVPLLDGELAGDHGRADAIAVLDDFEQWDWNR